MFDHNSRYYDIGENTFQAPDGREIRYKQRRFLPQGEQMPLLVEVSITLGDRLDTIASIHLGDPLQFWQVCDANNAMNPFDLTDVNGNRVRVPLPQIQNV